MLCHRPILGITTIKAARKHIVRSKPCMKKNVRTIWMVIATAASIANPVKAALLNVFV